MMMKLMMKKFLKNQKKIQENDNFKESTVMY